jgi:hypothetical protein
MVRRLYTLDQLREQGLTKAAIRWRERTGGLRRVDRGVYAEGSTKPSGLDRARAAVLAIRGVASGTLAGVLLGLDGVQLRRIDITVPPSRGVRRAGVRRRTLDRVTTVDGIRCTTGTQTLTDLAAILDDTRWEQALEAALRKTLTTLARVQEAAAGRQPGSARMRRVLAIRPEGAPPTESLLETLMVQLVRTIPGLPPPVRQLEIYDAFGQLVGRVDLAWPEYGLFVELDGEQHKNQPVYDASRETAIVAATGWLCGRFTWTEVALHPPPTGRRLWALIEQARRRPLPTASAVGPTS